MTDAAEENPIVGAPRRRAPRMAPDARRDQLLRTALQLFASKGIGEARHSDVAQAAGVAVPTTFHYFPTKTDLVDAALAEVSRFLFEEIVLPNDEFPEPAPLVIERILMAFCDAIDSHPDHVRVWLEWSVALREGLWHSYLVFYRKALDYIGQRVERGKQQRSIAADLGTDDAARVIVGLAHMIVQMKFSGSTREQIVHTVHSLVRGYLEAPRHPPTLRPV